MRFLIVDTVYPGFLQWLYHERWPGLAEKPYTTQLKAQTEGFFHTVSAWRPALEALGHEVMDVSANNAPLQLRWMLENDRLDKAKTFSDGLIFGSYVLRQHQELSWQVAIVAEQVKVFRPDILLCANLYQFDDNFLTMLDGYYGKAIGQHAAVMPRNSLKRYDLIISSLPNQVMAFRHASIRSELIGLAFDERLLPYLKDNEKQNEPVFIGSVSSHHFGRAQFLADIGRQLCFDFWGTLDWPQGIDTSHLHIRTHTPVFGLPMYQVLHDYRMALNYHLDAAGDYANNLRLFEATGVGTLLITDNKCNIRDYFEPDRECIVFDSSAECLARIKDLIANPNQAKAISIAGQERTLRDHSYYKRAEQLMSFL